MARSSRRSAADGGGHRQRTHLPNKCHVIRRERPSRTRPCPDPCPGASGALRASGGPPADSRRPCRLLNGEVGRCAMTAATATTTTRPMAAQPRR
jgi:hypothetical protein